MDAYTRSDLACESAVRDFSRMEGVTWREERVGGFEISELCIQTEDASKSIGKPRGRYVTVACGRLNYLGEESGRLLKHLLAGRLLGMARRLTEKPADSDFSVFVAGLGNAEMTADAVGPKTVGRLTATRHLREHETQLYHSMGCSALSALAPGVLGQTGIETLELLRGAVDFVKPDLVLVVDALAARSCDRLASTVQISDVGIAPGSGVGNHRSAITQKTLGIPVISMGVPTVVNSATLVHDVLHQAGITEMEEPLKRVLENGKSFFVSPKDSDVITESVSEILAGAIGEAFVGF